jgi:two-component system response regulator HupR/HoxA
MTRSLTDPVPEGRIQTPAPATEALTGFHGLVGRSGPMQALFERMRRVAPYDVPVLLVGETGTGKTRVARVLHELSWRRAGPFATLIRGAHLPDLGRVGLVVAESTMAPERRDRAVDPLEAVHGGTLVLDAVGDLTPDVQAQVAQVIRAAATRPAGVGVRVVATTPCDLAAAVRAERVRAELYYALRRAVLVVPPLRARLDDLPLLVEHVRRTVNARHGVRIEGVTAGALDRLAAHAWPGNVRELEAVLEEAMLLQGDGWLPADGLALDPPPRAVRIVTASGSADQGGRVATRVALALELAARSDGVSTSQFARASARSLAQARRDLGALMRQGRLRRVGRGRLVHYVVA